MLLLPILHHLLANLISRSRQNVGIFRMDLNALDPQTILYQSDPSMEKYVRAAVHSSRHENITLSEMNRYIYGKIGTPIDGQTERDPSVLDQRSARPSTYTEIYLGFSIPRPDGNRVEIEALSSNLISGYQATSVASNILYKYAMNDTRASIETTLIYKNTGHFPVQPSLGDLFETVQHGLVCIEIPSHVTDLGRLHLLSTLLLHQCLPDQRAQGSFSLPVEHQWSSVSDDRAFPLTVSCC
jgi:hypothetical protein